MVNKQYAPQGLGKRPVVRGAVMNPVDHPHGGGEGKAAIGRKKPTTQYRERETSQI
ncbi:hypothetical protein SEVIR_2G344201v4 [Setaria viridis]